jgi:hypothetical protein
VILSTANSPFVTHARKTRQRELTGFDVSGRQRRAGRHTVRKTATATTATKPHINPIAIAVCMAKPPNLD